MTSKAFQIKISLSEVEPEIWRRVLVPADILLSDLHHVIQTSMGWTNSHLHQFVKNRTFYTERMMDDDLWEQMNNVDYIGMKTSDLLKRSRSKIIYIYDFGDNWEHEVLVEKVLPLDNTIRYPIFLDGEMNCPPEDCGGSWGYANMLEILKQPDHEEYEMYLEWLGDNFDPKAFDKKEVNHKFRSFDIDSI